MGKGLLTECHLWIIRHSAFHFQPKFTTGASLNQASQTGYKFHHRKTIFTANSGKVANHTEAEVLEAVHVSKLKLNRCIDPHSLLMNKPLTEHPNTESDFNRMYATTGFLIFQI